VGSNNGAWAAAYLRAHPDAAAFLLEPNPRFEAELCLLEARYDAVHVHAAAWIADGNATFHFSRNDESSSLIAGAMRCDNARCNARCDAPCSALCNTLRQLSFVPRRQSRQVGEHGSEWARLRLPACQRPGHRHSLCAATGGVERVDPASSRRSCRVRRAAQVCAWPCAWAWVWACADVWARAGVKARARACVLTSSQSHVIVHSLWLYLLRRRVATIDLARLVSCVACPSDRLEMHLDIEGAEYEVCYTCLHRVCAAASNLRRLSTYYGRCCATCLPAALRAASVR